jgi:hypothetical protein
MKAVVRRKRKFYRAKVMDDNFHTSSLFDSSRELQRMRYSYDYMFESKFSKAMELYIEGNFPAAKDKFDECLDIKPRDGPTLTLVDFIIENGLKSPPDWDGYRVLSEK